MRFASLAAFFLSSSIFACSSASSLVEDSNDAGEGHDALPPIEGGSSPEASVDAGPDAHPITADAAPDAYDAAPDAPDAHPTAPLLLAAGSSIEIRGVTADGYVIYVEGTSTYAVPLAGGTPQAILHGGSPYETIVTGAVVATIINEDTSCAGGGTLMVWTSAQGATVVSTRVAPSSAALAGGGVSIAVDGSRIAYPAWVDDTCNGVGIASTKLTGNGATTQYRPTAACPAYVDYQANTFLASNDALLASGDCVSDAGRTFTLQLFSSSLTATTSIASFEGAFSADPGFDEVWVPVAGGGAEVVRSADATVLATVPSSDGTGVFDATGDRAYYVTNGALQELTISGTPTTTMLTPSGIFAPYLVGPTGGYLIDEEVIPNDAGSTTWYSVRAVTPGAASVLVQAAGEATAPIFTLDGNYVLTTAGNVLNALKTGAAAPTMIFPTVSSPIVPLRGSLVMVTATSDGTGYVVDPSGAATPWTIAPNTAQVVPVANGSKILYTTQGGSAGLYLVDAP